MKNPFELTVIAPVRVDQLLPSHELIVALPSGEVAVFHSNDYPAEDNVYKNQEAFEDDLGCSVQDFDIICPTDLPQDVLDYIYSKFPEGTEIHICEA
jgi:hypothetical protein